MQVDHQCPLPEPKGPRRPPPGANYPKYPILNNKYQQEVNSFKSWVDTENRRNADGTYLSRSNVTDYFDNVVVNERFNVNNDTASQIAAALQAFACHYEFIYPNGEIPRGKTIFRVRQDEELGNDCPIKQALWRRQNNYIRYKMTNDTEDPHHNLPTSVITFQTQRQVSTRLMKENDEIHKEWLQFLVTWNVLFATYMRMEGLKKVRLCDICVNHRGFAREGPNSDCLGIILQTYVGKGKNTVSNPIQQARTIQQTRKKNTVDLSSRSTEPIKSSGKRICFMWRHRDFECCGTLAIAMQLFVKLHDPEGFHFHTLPNQKYSRPWFEFTLLNSWAQSHRERNNSQTSTVDTAYRKVLKDKFGFDTNHLTHLRSSAIEQASSYGLDCMRISTQSKHIQDKINRFYMSQSNPEVLKMMSGFRTEEDGEYFVPRTHLIIPNEDNNKYVEHIFPQYKTWVDDYKSSNVPSEASKNFLHRVIPYLARTLIQDAPFLIKRYPSSTFAQYYRHWVLRNHPEYQKFNMEAPKMVEDMIDERRANFAKNLHNSYM